MIKSRIIPEEVKERNTVEALKQMLSSRDERIAQLEAKLESHRGIFDKIESLKEELDNIKNQKFAYFGDEECWYFKDDGYDNLHSLVCPVVMSKDKALELIKERQSKASLETENAVLKHRIVTLEEAFYDQINDCINFDGCELTQSILEQSVKVLKSDPKVTLSKNYANVAYMAWMDAFKSTAEGFNAECEFYDKSPDGVNGAEYHATKYSHFVAKTWNKNYRRGGE